MSPKPHQATVKAMFPDGTTMLFGSSYRYWFDQIAEYCVEFTKPMPEIRVSRDPWISHGGLKWCEFSVFQQELDKEGRGRKADYFTFNRPNRQDIALLHSAWTYWGLNRENKKAD